MRPPRVALDSSVVVAGLRSRLGASNCLLELVAEQRVVPLVTTALILEYEEVLKRPEQRLVTGMSEEDVAGFLAAFASCAEPVHVHFLWRPLLADPDVELVLECAVNGRDEGIVTHNAKDYARAFRELTALWSPSMTDGPPDPSWTVTTLPTFLARDASSVFGPPVPRACA